MHVTVCAHKPNVVITHILVNPILNIKYIEVKKLNKLSAHYTNYMCHMIRLYVTPFNPYYKTQINTSPTNKIG